MAEFLTKAKFSKRVQGIVFDHRCSYMDAVLHICTDNNIDPIDVKKFLSKAVKQKIEAEAQKLNFLPKTEALPV
jgi:kynurenine formamidase